MLWFWGGAGAFTFAAGALGLALWGDVCKDVVECRRRRILAVYDFFVAIATGAIFSAGFGQTACDALTRGVTLNGAAFRVSIPPVAMALFIGWSGNFLWPKILRKLGERVERDGAAQK